MLKKGRNICIFQKVFLPLYSRKEKTITNHLKKLKIMRYVGFVSFTLKFQSEGVPSSVNNALANSGFIVKSISTFTEVNLTTSFNCSADSKSEAIENVKKEFFKYCKGKGYNPIGGMTTQVMLSTLMDTCNSHNGDLVDKINYIWRSEKYDDSLKTIATALYERDIEECNEKNIFINEYENDLFGFLYEMFMHVCDDADLEVVINFVRARNSKGETIWADSDAWDE